MFYDCMSWTSAFVCACFASHILVYSQRRTNIKCWWRHIDDTVQQSEANRSTNWVIIFFCYSVAHTQWHSRRWTKKNNTVVKQGLINTVACNRLFYYTWKCNKFVLFIPNWCIRFSIKNYNFVLPHNQQVGFSLTSVLLYSDQNQEHIVLQF